jgi:hypothetical protein
LLVCEGKLAGTVPDTSRGVSGEITQARALAYPRLTLSDFSVYLWSLAIS